jgi:hypothetical protein
LHSAYNASDNKLKVGQSVRIQFLSRCVELNGHSARVCTGEDDEGRYLVDLNSRILRLKRHHLEALVDVDEVDKTLQRPKKRRLTASLA